MNFLEYDFVVGAEYEFIIQGFLIPIVRRVIEHIPGSNELVVISDEMNHTETINLNQVIEVEQLTFPQTGSSKRRKSRKSRKRRGTKKIRRSTKRRRYKR